MIHFKGGWAKNFSTLVNGTGEFSQATHSGVHPSGDIIVSGVFSGETDFGGFSINATSQDVFVAMFDAFSGTTLWVTSGGGVGADALDDRRLLPMGKLNWQLLQEPYLNGLPLVMLPKEMLMRQSSSSMNLEPY